MALSVTSLSMHLGSSQTIIVSLTGQTGFQNHIDLFPIASNKNFTFSQYPTGDVYVGQGQTTRMTLIVNAGGAPAGSYVLWVKAETYYLPVVNAIQLIQITVTGPVTILGVSPLVFFLILGGVAAADAIAIIGALFLTRRRRLSKTSDTGPDSLPPQIGQNTRRPTDPRQCPSRGQTRSNSPTNHQKPIAQSIEFEHHMVRPIIRTRGAAPHPWLAR
jgi:hypothetical protein